MAIYNIGYYIREKRKRLNISQEDLCGELMAVSTLSKIENGKATPSKKVLEYLCQKLGIDESYYNVNTSDGERKRAKLEANIMANVVDTTKKLDYHSLLEEYKNCTPSMDTLEQQFYDYISILTEPLTFEERYNRCMKALSLTFKNFNFSMKLSDYYFSTLEIYLINTITLSHYKENKDESLSMMYQIKEYMEKKYVDLNLLKGFYPGILYNIQNWEGFAENWQAAYDVTLEGINFCVKYGNLSVLHTLLLDKAFNLMHLKRYVEAKKAYIQAFVVYHIVGLDDEIKKVLPKVNSMMPKDYQISEEELNI